MTCDTALERMMEAGPAELRAEADTELARHIESCGRCAAVADAIREELRVVSNAMLELAGADTGPSRHAAADAATDAALEAIGKGEDDGVAPADRHGTANAGPRRGAGQGGRSRASRLAPLSRAAWVPLAAAAALAAVLVFRGGDPLTDTQPPGGGEATPASLEPRVSVTPPTDRAAAIMKTENPNITIVWLYEREES